jgi:hypothetical protein
MEETSEDNSKKLDPILALLANPVFICLPYILLRSAASNRIFYLFDSLTSKCIYSPKVLLTCSTQLEERILFDRRAERQDLHIRKAFGPGLPVHPSIATISASNPLSIKAYQSPCEANVGPASEDIIPSGVMAAWNLYP